MSNSIFKLMQAQEAAFETLTDVLTNPTALDLETQNFRANLAMAVANMVPAGAFDGFGPQEPAEVLTPNFGDVQFDPDPQDEIQAAEEQAALEQVTVLPHVPMNPHGAPPLGGVG